MTVETTYAARKLAHPKRPTTPRKRRHSRRRLRAGAFLVGFVLTLVAGQVSGVTAIAHADDVVETSVPTVVADDGTVVQSDEEIVAQASSTPTPVAAAQINARRHVLVVHPDDSTDSSSYPYVSGYLYCCDAPVKFSASIQMPSGLWDVCVDPVHGSADGGASITARLYFNLYRAHDGLHTSDSRTTVYFGLDQKNHYWCWHNVNGGTVNSADHYEPATYNIGFENLTAPHQAHVYYHADGWGNQGGPA